MKLNDKQKVIAVGCLFLAVVGGTCVMNFFKFRGRTKLLTQMEKYNREELAAQEKIKRIPKLLEEKSELIAAVDKYTEILPPEEHVQHDAFVEIIDGYRKDTEILIQKADYVQVKDTSGKKGAGKAEESFLRHRYRFSLLGTVPDFLDFLNKIENHTRFLKVDSFKIKPFVAADGGSSGGGDPSEPRRAAGGGSSEDKELQAATKPVKEIELTVSTYTYRGAKSGK